jgi:transcriptional regulator with PAS, ATPase and Fis domain
MAARRAISRWRSGDHLFDEIGTISLETQTKLLRVIQEREFMPLGSAGRSVDVRIVAATSRLKSSSGREVPRGPTIA